MNSSRFLLVLAVSLLGLSACSGKLIEGKKIDYKSAGKRPPLEVPADLAVPPSSDRYAIPETSAAGATYSEYAEGQGGRQPGPSTVAVLPQDVANARIDRGGSQRWLVVEGDPESLWPQVKEFWQDTGFLIDRDMPEIGIMETDWAENRAKIADSALRKLIGKVLDQAYSYPERDKFRTRVERGIEPGTTEIYISHRGAYQVVVGERQKEQVKWQMRPTDPELEAEMLYRMMRRLGVSEEQVVAQKSAPPAQPPRARLTPSEQTPGSLILADEFDRAWRRVGLALDRVGFTVEDRDRSKGIYYVRYLDPDVDGKGGDGFMSKLAFWRDKDAGKDKEQYRISVLESDTGSEVKVLDAAGEVSETQTAARILALLQAELK
jgi:outer membrane protein assembly factor BamC